MSGARDLEIYLLLALEEDLAVVQSAREEHQTVDLDKLLAGETFVGLVRLLAGLFIFDGGGRSDRFRFCLKSGHQTP